MLTDAFTDSDSSTLDELLAVFELPDQQHSEASPNQVGHYELKQIPFLSVYLFNRHPFHLHLFKILIHHLHHHHPISFHRHHRYLLNDLYFYPNHLHHPRLTILNNKSQIVSNFNPTVEWHQPVQNV